MCCRLWSLTFLCRYWTTTEDSKEVWMCSAPRLSAAGSPSHPGLSGREKGADNQRLAEWRGSPDRTDLVDICSQSERTRKWGSQGNKHLAGASFLPCDLLPVPPTDWTQQEAKGQRTLLRWPSWVRFPVHRTEGSGIKKRNTQRDLGPCSWKRDPVAGEKDKAKEGTQCGRPVLSWFWKSSTSRHWTRGRSRWVGWRFLSLSVRNDNI